MKRTVLLKVKHHILLNDKSISDKFWHRIMENCRTSKLKKGYHALFKFFILTFLKLLKSFFFFFFLKGHGKTLALLQSMGTD